MAITTIAIATRIMKILTIIITRALTIHQPPPLSKTLMTDNNQT